MVLDLYKLRVVGWVCSRRPDSAVTIQALGRFFTLIRVVITLAKRSRNSYGVARLSKAWVAEATVGTMRQWSEPFPVTKVNECLRIGITLPMRSGILNRTWSTITTNAVTVWMTAWVLHKLRLYAKKLIGLFGNSEPLQSAIPSRSSLGV